MVWDKHVCSTSRGRYFEYFNYLPSISSFQTVWGRHDPSLALQQSLSVSDLPSAVSGLSLQVSRTVPRSQDVFFAAVLSLLATKNTNHNTPKQRLDSFCLPTTGDLSVHINGTPLKRRREGGALVRVFLFAVVACRQAIRGLRPFR